MDVNITKYKKHIWTDYLNQFGQIIQIADSREMDLNS